LIATCIPAYGQSEIVVHSVKGKSLYKFVRFRKDSNRNSALKKGSYYSFKAKEKIVCCTIAPKRTKDILNFEDYQAFSFDVKIVRQDEFGSAVIFIHLTTPNGGVWKYDIRPSSIPSNNEWHRVTVPVRKAFSDSQTLPIDKKQIIRINLGLFLTMEYDNPIEIDVRNLILRQVLIDEVTVEILNH
jgi:hypothetical protein